MIPTYDFFMRNERGECMNRVRLLLVCLFVLLVSLNYTPGAKGITFHIGDPRDSDIDEGQFLFTSGVILSMNEYEPLNFSKIFDGNLSTGFDQTYSFWSSLYIEMVFPQGLNITNITAKPSFGAGKSNYSIEAHLPHNPIMIYDNQVAERTFHLNCSITSLVLIIYETGTDHFYFNDLIINYSLGNYNSSQVLQAVNDLSKSVDIISYRLQNLSSRIDTLNVRFNALNDTFNNLNLTDSDKILENITNLWDFCKRQNSTLNEFLKNFDELNRSVRENITDLWQTNKELNQSIINLTQKLDNLNLSEPKNLTQLQNEQKALAENVSTLKQLYNEQNSTIAALEHELSDLNASVKENITDLFALNSQLGASISDIYNKINGLNLTLRYDLTQLQTQLQSLQEDMSEISGDLASVKSDVDGIPGLRSQIEKAASDIAAIQKNITDIRNQIPAEYDDSDILAQLEDLLADIGQLKNDLLRLESELPSEYDDAAIKSEISMLVSANDLLSRRLAEMQSELDNLTADLGNLDEELDTYKGTLDKEGVAEEDAGSDMYMFLVLFLVVFVILIIIILKLFLWKPKPATGGDAELMEDTVHEILTDRELRNSRLSDEQYQAKLENKYQRGEITQETYFYIRSVLEVPEDIKGSHNRKK